MSPTLHPITTALAHVSSDDNLLVRSVQACPEEHTYRSAFVIDGTHPYLYENPAIANHVSGTTFIDMARQLLKAISHLYYATPLDSRFVLHGIDIEFSRWAKLGVAIEATVSVDMDEAKRADAPRTCRTTITWKQQGHPVARARSSFTTFSAALEAKLMARQYRQPPADGGDEGAARPQGADARPESAAQGASP